ncbi:MULTISPECIES: hypothetical protein [unclassified Streptomyces]|uniref:hypothetical protein n=1 Tax=unclassified Streptomyces TaxID=2593676 RepID=UPI000F936168|nr:MULTISPECIES: hypothetical protein [unclassified Streptomyces]WSG48732.1 hypothetical protein OHA38_02365 [Streptomyces sp. NBC_01732]WSW99382.1 hypothetical protein OG355_02470 [Streptomyces sp. NBC_00987]RPK61137.1 hypothetical protein EES42_32315 [Streptomyces sp. ADI95-17]WSC25692.1 hypothetical protein OG902_02880 [Streptomyces sp. NBC_01768]WSP51429.1 hypothetical protein OG348_39485 [Streptomyces sp. NBC_01243]
MSGALNVRTVIDGTEYSPDDIRRWELDRARTALTLLKSRIGDELMRELLTEDLRAADRAMAPLPGASDGAWRSAVTEMEIDGIDADGFLTWWQGRLANADRGALLAANPEHYLADSADGVVEIIETIGSGPLRFFLTFHEGVEIEGEGHETYPVRIGGTGRLADGTEVARVMHEFGDGPRGLRIRLTIQFPASAPEHVFTGHQWHFACEFLNWLEAAHAAR